ncbi:MAG: hypothetical protein O3C28_14190 [Proteobacteria bacterium]|nr:hypothetical protein [Pseudomonadota bacterium]
MVVTEVACQDPFQLMLVQYDDVIQAVASDAADHSFHLSILPRAPRSRQDLFEIHAFDTFAELAPIDIIAIPDQVPRCRGIRKRLKDLLPSPMRRWMFGDLEMNNLAPAMGKDYQDGQHLEPYRWHN